MKRIILLIAAATVAVCANGQIMNMMNSVRTVSVKATLADAQTGEPIPYAAVWLTQKDDTVICNYGISDDAGRVVISNVKQGRYDVHIETMGYEPFLKPCDVKVQEFESERNLGRIPLTPSNIQIEGVTVSATAVPVKVKKDTIEYNANAYHVTESAMLGDLLKKMPGMKVSNDGSVKVNGEQVNKITMDGKTLFMKEPAMAVRNLPAKIVDKVKVIDRAKDEAQFTGIGTKDDQEKVIDLQLKEEYAAAQGRTGAQGAGTSALQRQRNAVALLADRPTGAARHRNERPRAWRNER